MSDLVKLAQLQKYWEEGQLEALQEAAEGYMQQYPRDSRGYLYGGRASLALSDYDKAKECFSIVAGFDKTNEEAMLALERIDSERVSNPELLAQFQNYWEEGRFKELQEAAEDYTLEYQKDLQGFLYGGQYVK